MATVVLTDASATIGGVDLSDHIKSIELNFSTDMLDDTVMGDDTRSNKPGLYDWSASVTFLQDYAASNVDVTLWDNRGATFTFVGKPTSDAVSATNPSYSGTAALASFQPISGGVGDLSENTAELVSAGTLSRATS